MIKTKKQMFLMIGSFLLIILLGTVTYAFFNYTRTGLANTISVGRVSFTSSQSGTFNLTNVFPITGNEALSDNTNSSEVVITITGDTTYTNGLEYLVTVEDVNIETSTYKKIPIGLIVTPEEDNSELGEANVNYFNTTGGRGGDTSYYKVLKGQNTGDVLKDGDYILVGYIRPGVAEVNGKIGIRAFIDQDKILISDTYDGTESDNMGTPSSMATGKVVLTTDEWNSIQGNNAISFKVRVQSNEGIWVGEPLSRNDMININSTFTNEQKSSFTEINFIRMSEEMINTHADLIDLTASGGSGVVKAWIDGTKLYIASPGETYFPVNSTAILKDFNSVTKINFNNINTSDVENMTAMFWGDSSLLSIDLSNFNTSNVESMLSMFRECSSLVNIDLSMLDTSSVLNMNNLVQYCDSLQYINLSGLGSSNLTSIWTLFQGDVMLKEIVMSNFNFGSFDGFSSMFDGLTNIETIDLSDSTMNSLTSTAGMFSGLSNLRTIYVSNTWNVSNITNSSSMFDGCTSLVGGNGTRYIDKATTAQPNDTSYKDKTYAVIDDANHEGYLTLKTN